jgi:hypothetical protein
LTAHSSAHPVQRQPGVRSMVKINPDISASSGHTGCDTSFSFILPDVQALCTPPSVSLRTHSLDAMAPCCSGAI